MRKVGHSRRNSLKALGGGVSTLAMSRRGTAAPGVPTRPPNILFALADDWSWPHASIAHTLGDTGVIPW
jgi:hypothetical protein